MNYIEERNELVEFGRRMSQEGLSSGTSGNLSIYLKEEGLVLITPSGMGYFDIMPEDIVVMDLEGRVVEGDRKPSSEYHLHTLFYKNRPNAGAVVHTHSIYSTALSVMRKPILPVHYAIVEANAFEIPCAKYARYGTEELARNAMEAIGEDSNAVLLANHGLVAGGATLPKAYGLVKTLEFVAEIQLRAYAAGEPVLLTREELEEVKVGFKGYGQSESAAPSRKGEDDETKRRRSRRWIYR